MKIDALVPAAGVGRRMGGSIPKQYMTLGTKTMLELTVDALRRCPAVNRIVIAVSPEDEYFDSLKLSGDAYIIRACGGKERSDTVREALSAVTTEWVLVHDAARPFVASEDILKLTECCEDPAFQGGILASPCTDTLKLIERETAPGVISIERTLDRSKVYRALTPQLFRTQQLKKALLDAKEQNIPITDEASALEYAGIHPRIIEGRSDNIKITTKEDLYLARALLKQEDK